ncbi:MAG: hypothetical protein H3C26_15790 [Rhodocyclaceae bacterium]|nr:hypothetical protein [Rhodocyclaceae bacterium]
MRILDGHNVSPGNRLDVSAGGLLVGPGGATSDSIPATLPPGSFIVNAESVRIVGVERLDRLLDGVQALTMPAQLSTSEYVVPPPVVAALGRQFFCALNTAGNVIRDGDSPDPQEHERLTIDWLDQVLAGLAELREKGVEGLSPEYRWILATHETAEDGITLSGAKP